MEILRKLANVIELLGLARLVLIRPQPLKSVGSSSNSSKLHRGNHLFLITLQG